MRYLTTVLAFTLGLIVFSAPNSALAQEPGAPGGTGGGWGGGMRGHHGGRYGGGQRGNQEAADPVVLDGPPAADFLTSYLELDSAHSRQYAATRDSFMTATQVTRDSAQAIRAAMRQGMENRDFSAMRENGGSFRRLAGELAKQQKALDDDLKHLFTKDQFRQYQDWRDQQRKLAEDQREQMRRRSGGDSSAGN